MALIGPSPTVASVSSLIQTSSKSELFEIFDEVVHYTDGSILSSLAANSTVRPKLVEYLTPEKLTAAYEGLKNTSDPNFVALSWLADEVEPLRAHILDLVTSTKPMPKESLTVLTRLLAKQKLDVEALPDEVIEQVLPWLRVANDADHEDKRGYKPSHWQTLANLFIKAAAPSHEKCITAYVENALQNDATDARIREIVKPEPEATQSEPEAKKSEPEEKKSEPETKKSKSQKKKEKKKENRLKKEAAEKEEEEEKKASKEAETGEKEEGNAAAEEAESEVKPEDAAAETEGFGQKEEEQESKEPEITAKIANVTLLDSDKLDIAFATIDATYEIIPRLVDLFWAYPESLLKPSNDLFKLLSTLCNSKDGRDRTTPKFGTLVSKAADEGNHLAAIVDAKLLAGMTSQTGDIEKAAKRLDDLSSRLFEVEFNETLLEGLACSVMLAGVRSRISKQLQGQKPGHVVSQLVQLLKTIPGTAGYAILAILVHLARFPIKPTKDYEQKKQLRIQTMGKSILDLEEELDLENEEVKQHAREESGRICDQVMGSGLLSWTSTNITKLSYTAQEQLAYLLRELTSHQEKHRRERLAMQGATVIAMYLWTTTTPKPLDAHMKAVAAATISKILATVAPQVALTDKVAKPVVVPALCAQIHNESSDRTNLDTFEALRALTNLASIDDNRLKLVISKNAWPRLPAALNSEFLQIRRSSLELICNLMVVPRSAEHFLQGTPDSSALLSLLGQSLTVDDEDSRLAAAGALAILSEWETAPERIGHNDECVVGLSRCLGLFPEDDALLLRVLFALNTIIKVTAKDMDDEVVERIVFNEGLAHLEELVDTLDPEAHNEVAKLVLQCIKLIVQYKAKNGAS